MDYRFSITPRLLILAAVSLLALFILLFLLGIFVGQRLGPVSALEPSKLPKVMTPPSQALPTALTSSTTVAAPPATPAPAVQAKP